MNFLGNSLLAGSAIVGVLLFSMALWFKDVTKGEVRRFLEESHSSSVGLLVFKVVDMAYLLVARPVIAISALVDNIGDERLALVILGLSIFDWADYGPKRLFLEESGERSFGERAKMWFQVGGYFFSVIYFCYLLILLIIDAPAP